MKIKTVARMWWGWVFPAGLGVGLLGFLIVALRYGWLNPLFNDTTHRLGQGADFFGVYQTAYDAWRGQSIYLYADAVPGFTQVVPYFYGFVYWPAVAYLAGLLLLLPPWPAYWAWVGFLCLLVLCALALTWRETSTGAERVLVALMWLCYTPLYLECHMGQFTLPLAFLTYAMLLAYERGRFAAGDGCWVAGVLWKQLGLYLTPLLLRLKRWRTLGVAALLSLASTLPYFMFFPADWTFYWEAQQHPIVIHAGNLGFQAWLVDLAQRSSLLAQPVVGSFSGVNLLVALWTLGIAVVALLATLRPRHFAALESTALWIAVYLLTFKHVWEHHFVWLLPFLVLLVLRRRRPIYFVLYLLLAVPTPFWLFDLPTGSLDPQPLWSPVVSALYHASKAWPTLALFAVLVVDLWQRERRPLLPSWPWLRRLARCRRSA